MKENTVVAFQNPSDFQKDPLTEVLQAGARELLAQAVEAEVSVFLGSHAALVDAAGRRRVVRNGYLPERFIQTGIGPVSVRQPRVRDRGDGAIRFTSAILPRYLRRAKSLEDLLPWLYLKGISTGDFGEALAALLGSSAPGLSASTITRLKEVWGVEAERWQRRDLTAKRYVYFWVDGIYFSARMEEEKQCILVIVGATDKGQKELIAIADGYRESEQSWLEVLLDLKRRGLEMGPQLALGDGALGFWKALRQVYPGAREQRCWVHKTGNVLNKLPKGLQKKAKGRLQDIWMAETRKDAESAFDFFLEAYGPKYDKAAACLAKDRDVLLTFYVAVPFGAGEVDGGTAAALDAAMALVDGFVPGRVAEVDRLEVFEDGFLIVLDGADHVVGAAPEQAARRLVLRVHRIDGDNAACEVRIRVLESSRTAGISLLLLSTSTCPRTMPESCSPAATIIRRPSSVCFEAPRRSFPSMATGACAVLCWPVH